jgi:hypothetical protein
MTMDLNVSFSDLDSYLKWKNHDNATTRESYHNEILKKWRESNLPETSVWGWCDICAVPSNFLLDDLYSNEQGSNRQPNWRERLVCPDCNLNARMRASFTIMKSIFAPESKIWITEQSTKFFQAAVKNYRNLIGSEYLGAGYVSGEVLANGIRHEDCSASSHKSDSLDGVLSFDVMEHIPNYREAIFETYRVLRPNGVFFWTAPFNANIQETSVRATVLSDGTIENILPPIWHGDPMNHSGGILCYQIFGWDVHDLLRSAGFSEVQVHLFWSKSRAILGEPLPFFIAKK